MAHIASSDDRNNKRFATTEIDKTTREQNECQSNYVKYFKCNRGKLGS